ncbi:MAG: hypothetical protein JWN78_3008 [Bacteroidota bacterium]|nr:hypothetical protein [Bacteroidota bacterium]
MKILYALFLVFLLHSAHAAVVLNITDFGATPGAGTLQTVYIQAAVDSAERAGGGTVIIPQGLFLSGTIFLKDNVMLEIAKNGILLGAASTSVYPNVIPAVRSYTDRYPQRSLIYAEGKKNIGIRGEGTLDGNGLSLDFLLNSHDKPLGVRFISCTHVLYEGITMKNSGFWMMHNLNCDTLTIRNLKIINHNFGNGDGIDIDGSRHVLVENCTADCNDDPMVIKTTNLGTAEDIEIRNCTFSTYSRAIKIGTETYGPVRKVYIHDCTVKQSTAGPLGSLVPGDCGIQLSIVDGGAMEDVTVENINIKGVQTPIFIRLGDRGDPFETGGPRPAMGSLHHVIMRNITAETSGDIASSITGIPGFPVRDITLQNIALTVPGGKGPVPAGDTVPENINGKPGFDMFGNYLPAYGLFIRHADSVVLQNVCITTTHPDQRPEIYWEDTAHVEISPCIATAVFQQPVDLIGIYPNPVTETLHIYLKNEKTPHERFVISDVLGATKYLGNFTGNQLEINVADLNKGLYFLTVSGDGNPVVVGKFLKW